MPVLHGDSAPHAPSRQLVLPLVAASILGLHFPSVASATEWHVSPDGSGDAPSLQSAIDAAADGDTVRLSSGVFDEGDYVLVSDKGLSIIGDGWGTETPGIIFAAHGPYECHVRALSVQPGTSGISAIYASSLTLEDVAVGGREYAVDIGHVDDVVIRNSVFDGNEHPPLCCLPQGGAVSVQTSESILIENCTFVDNRSLATWGGGAIGLNVGGDASVQILRNLFLGNAGELGGAITVKDGTFNLEIAYNVFVGNVASDAVIRNENSGGRIYGNVFAFNGTAAIWDLTYLMLCGCNVFWKTEPVVGECEAAADWWPSLQVDPQFCDWVRGDFSVAQSSPALLVNLPDPMEGACNEGLNLGGVVVGCEGVVPVYELTWGGLKKRFAEPRLPSTTDDHDLRD
ncbi:MAG: right-handed parallel beta-helix repeat-containing protein [Candidatus Eisenbacteria bacterium]